VLVPALVLVVAALAVGGAGVLARVHRLPRNRVLGVRTAWTMSRVDTFRRANRAAAPAFVAAGAAGIVAGVAAALTPSTVAAVVLLVVGVVGLLALLGVAGTVGARFAAVDEAEERAAIAEAAANPCTLGASDEEEPAGPGSDATCAPAGACGGACSLCPRGAATGTTAGGTAH
jgi:hypothetical protein